MTTIKNLTKAAVLITVFMLALALLSAVCFAQEPDAVTDDGIIAKTADTDETLIPTSTVTENTPTATEAESASNATEAENTLAETETVSTPSVNDPKKEELEEQIKDAVNKTDEYLSGNVWWESAKTWIIENLSTVAGLIMALAAIGTALFARVGLIPHAVNTVTAFGNNCQSKFDSILNTVETDGKARAAFIKNADAILAKMQEQANENASLREELAESRKQVIELCQHKAASESALTEASVMIAEALESVVEISSVAQIRKDAIFSRLEAAKKRIRECQSDGVTEKEV